MSMRETLHLCGLLLLGLLAARSWGRHEAPYYYIDCMYDYVYYPEFCADHGSPQRYWLDSCVCFVLPCCVAWILTELQINLFNVYLFLVI